jgi:hypothetical protein
MPIMRAVNWFCQFMDDLDVRIQASKKRRMEEEAEELRLYTLKAYEEAKKYQA